MSLKPLPQPLGVFTYLCSPQPEPLIVKGTYTTESYTATGMASKNRYFTIDAESSSWSHRKHFKDARNDSPLFDLRKDNQKINNYCYFGEDPLNKSWRWFDIRINASWSGKLKTQLNFTDVMSGSREILYLENKAGRADGTIYWGGTPENGGVAVANVEKDEGHMRTEYHVYIAPGLDPMLVLAMVMAVDDRERTKIVTELAGGV